MEGKGQEREEYKDTQKEAARQERQVHRRSVLRQF